MKLLIILSLAALASANPRIIGGTEASRGEFPHQGSLEFLGSHSCGCVLVDADYALTAAHCVAGRNPANMRVLFGAHNRQTDGTRYEITSATVHEDFVNSSPWPNDIAIMALSTSVDLGDEYTDTVSISSDGIDFPFTGCVISGWGVTTTGGGSVANLLQRADTDVITQDECRTHWTGINQIRDVHVCVFDTADQQTGACNGDSGGPLTCDQGLVGLTSWGRTGCFTNFPSVYCRVSQFCDWLSDQTSGVVACS